MSDELQLKRKMLIKASDELESIKHKCNGIKLQIQELQVEYDYLSKKSHVYADMCNTLLAEIKSLEGDAR